MSDAELFAWVVGLLGGADVIARCFDEVFSPGTVPPALAGPNSDAWRNSTVFGGVVTRR